MAARTHAFRRTHTRAQAHTHTHARARARSTATKKSKGNSANSKINSKLSYSQAASFDIGEMLGLAKTHDHIMYR